MHTEETFPQAMKRLDDGIERDRKLGNLYYNLTMGVLYIGIALSFFFLCFLIHQSHIA